MGRAIGGSHASAQKHSRRRTTLGERRPSAEAPAPAPKDPRVPRRKTRPSVVADKEQVLLDFLSMAEEYDLVEFFGRSDQLPVRTEPKSVVKFEFAQRRALWAERHAIDLIAQGTGLVAVHFGASYSDVDHKGLSSLEFRKRFRSTEEIGKRPDLLIFTLADYEELLSRYEQIDQLLYVPDRELPDFVMERAVRAVEVKDSVIWSADRPDRESPATRKFKGTEWDGKGFRKGAQITHTILGVDEFARMQRWRDHWGIPMNLAQFSLDRSYLTDFATAERAATDGSGIVQIKKQDSPWRRDGQTEEKEQFWFPFSIGEEFGEQEKAPHVQVQKIHFANGTGEQEDVLIGGKWSLLPTARQMLLGEL